MLETKLIQVMIVEDDVDWLRGLERLIKKEVDMEVVVAVDTSEKARSAFVTYAPDIILMDIMLAGQAEGLELTKQISTFENCKIIMLSSLEKKEIIIDSFQFGAINYLFKNNFREIPDTIRKAYQNKSEIHSDVSTHIREEIKRLKVIENNFEVSKLLSNLTPMEKQVLNCMIDGNKQKEIAEKLFISIHTVKNHVNQILSKFGEKNSKAVVKKIRKYK